MTRLLSSLDPSGIGAVVNSIITIYRAIESAVEYMRPMLEIVRSVLDGVGEIARGAIAGAATFVESSMARAVPIVVGFLANQVGLGSIGTRIGETVESLRERVAAAVDWLIEKGRALLQRALAFGRGVAGAARTAAGTLGGWLGLRRSFTMNGEAHDLFFKPGQAQATLFVHSVEMSLHIFLAELARQNTGDHEKLARIENAQRLVTEIEAMTSTAAPASPSTAGGPATARLDDAVRERIDRLGGALREIGGVAADVSGAFAAYRGLHWWLTPGREASEEGPAYAAQLALEFVGVREISEASRNLLTYLGVDASAATNEEIDHIVALIRGKLASLRDGIIFTLPDGREYVDRYHFLLGRFVTGLTPFRARSQAAARVAELDPQIRVLQSDVSSMVRESSAFYDARERLRSLREERRSQAAQVEQPFADLLPVQGAPFISTSKSPLQAAKYALGQKLVPPGKARRDSGIVGRVLVYVADIKVLESGDVDDVEALRRAGRIMISERINDDELSFTAEIPGEHLRSQLDAEASQSDIQVARNAQSRAEAEGQRFGGLRPIP